LAIELSKIAESSIAMLKCETQLNCFLHLHQIANVSSFKVTDQRKLEGLKGNDGNSSVDEADMILSEFISSIQSTYDNVRLALTKEIIGIIFYPLCILVPQILMKYVSTLIELFVSFIM
jgi:hypothetical protein